MMNQLEQLKKLTTVVADTGDFRLIEKYAPQDSTTNPSLILRAVQKEEYRALLEKTVQDNKNCTTEQIIDRLLVAFAQHILSIVPGRVSTEVDAHLSFDTQATINRSRELIDLYRKAGIDTHRILIKIAATWEGIKAAQFLEKEGISCNLTLMFSMPQAVACAEANVQLISPFVGRIYDWYKKQTGKEYTADDDPGVQSVKQIYNYYRKFDYRTEVMGASFRNTSQLTALAGCDLLTISPQLLDELAKSQDPVVQKLSTDFAVNDTVEKVSYDEKQFRFALNNNAMATEKLSEGIRQFCSDTVTLEKIIDCMRSS